MDFPKIPDLDGGLDNNIIFTLLPGLVSYKIVEPVSKPFHNNFQLARHLHEC
jgi:hypothetical protein